MPSEELSNEELERKFNEIRASFDFIFSPTEDQKELEKEYYKRFPSERTKQAVSGVSAALSRTPAGALVGMAVEKASGVKLNLQVDPAEIAVESRSFISAIKPQGQFQLQPQANQPLQPQAKSEGPQQAKLDTQPHSGPQTHSHAQSQAKFVKSTEDTKPSGGISTSSTSSSSSSSSSSSVASKPPKLEQDVVKLKEKADEIPLIKETQEIPSFAVVTTKGGAVRSDAIPEGSNLEYIAPGRVRFDDVEFRAVRDLSHLSERELRDIAIEGYTPLDQISGTKIHGHHYQQKYHREEGAFVVEVPENSHSIGNKVQHPLGTKGGLSKEERKDWNKLREKYWKERAK